MAGLVAAARARELGAEPPVLEKLGRSGGSIPAAGGAGGGASGRRAPLTPRHAEVTSVEGERYEARNWSEVDVVQWTARQPGARAWFRVPEGRLGERVRERTVEEMVEAAASAGAPPRPAPGAPAGGGAGGGGTPGAFAGEWGRPPPPGAPRGRAAAAPRAPRRAAAATGATTMAVG